MIYSSENRKKNSDYITTQHDFLTYSNKVESVYAFGLSVHGLTLSYTFQMSTNSYRLLIIYIA